MADEARVVVIGGGVAGCALLYNLTRLGWRDVILVEKGELTSGSTWHAAGNVPHYTTSWALTRLYRESTDFYDVFERETGRAIGFHRTGAIRIASTRALMDEHRRAAGKAGWLGVPMRLVEADELGALFPYLNLDGLVGGVHTLADGHVDPASLTNALADEARAAGATIRRRERVTGLSRDGAGWRVATEKGEIAAQHVVNAGGLWLREVSALVGHAPPALPMERQYLITEDVPGIEELGRELPILRDLDAPLYIRQERRSLLLGLFDQAPVFWAEAGTPPGFDQELLQPDLERVSHAFERAIERVPVLGELGVKTVINGPLMRTPDGNPLVGPVPNLPGYWVCGGFYAGFSLSPSCTAHLARWIVEGEPPTDVMAMDPRRFGGYADADFVRSRTRAAYVHEYGVVHPHEEAPREDAARTSPLHEAVAARRAVFGERAGWEIPQWFAAAGVEATDRPSFRRANWFTAVANECHAVARGVGMLDLAALARYEVSGPGAEAMLARLSAGRLPEKPGAIAMAPLLSYEGRLVAMLAAVRLGPGRFYLTGSALNELPALDWLQANRPAGQAVAIRNASGESGALLLAGPQAGTLLSRLVDGPVPRLASRGFALSGREDRPVLVLGLSAVDGEGYELHADNDTLVDLHEAVRREGADLGLVDFGWRAFDSMRLERGLPRWGIDYGQAGDLQACGLGRWLDPGREGFIGREALLARQGEAPAQRLVLLSIPAGDDPGGIDAAGAEPVFRRGEAVGLTTSGAYGHRVRQGRAFAWLTAGAAEPGTTVEVELMGERHPAEVIEPPVG